MKTTPEQQSVGAGIGIILTHLLDDARGCASRLNHEPNNEDSIHDFRVSIRRLRVWCQAIDDDGLVSVPKSCHRRLKSLVQMTNDARDLDVHLSLLKKNSKGLSKKDKAAVLKIEKKWKRKIADSSKKSARQVGKLFAKVDTDCVGVISKITKEGTHRLLLSFWIGSVFPQMAKKLDVQLSSVKSIDDVKTIHKARLGAKALRYLAESFASESSEAGQLVDDLRDLQDVIGSLRDNQTLIVRVRNSKKVDLPELVLDRLRQHEKALFKKFEKKYMKAPGFQKKAQLLFASIVQS